MSTAATVYTVGEQEQVVPAVVLYSSSNNSHTCSLSLSMVLKLSTYLSVSVHGAEVSYPVS